MLESIYQNILIYEPEQMD
ncbi:hypothetical protein [Chryseobacterium shigense]|nr:hypothetical protein [Chryseobacterium shigense]